MSFASVLFFFAAGCKQNENEPGTTPDPVLDVTTPIIQAAAEGGVYEISYTVENPVEGAELELVSDVDWVKDPDCSAAGKVSVTVDPNYENTGRNANLLLTYKYGEGEIVEEEIIVHQVYQYDYNFEAEHIYGGYFTERTSDEPDYCLIFSDLGMSESEGYVANGTYYRLDICVGSAPEDYRNIVIPEGTYSLSKDPLRGNSFWGTVNSDVSEWVVSSLFTEGTVTVTREGDNSKYEAVLTDEEGKIHHLTFDGSEGLDLYCNAGLKVINWDMELTDVRIASNLSYVDRNDDVMMLTWALSAGEDVNTDLSIVSIEMYAPYDQYKLLPGSYKISSKMTAYTMFPGYVDLSTLYPYGTYAVYANENTSILALFTDGSIDVVENDGIYTVDINLLTAEGFSVTGTYKGEIEIPNIPGSGFSTLDGDYTVDLSDATSFTSFNGDGIFSIALDGPFEQDPDEPYVKQGKGESVAFEIMTDTDYDSETEFDAVTGIPSGTYTVASDLENPQPWEFVPGYQDAVGQGLLHGTYYVGAWEAGYISHCAPAIDGELNIKNNGDGTYTIKFSFKDDIGNTWDGEWSGDMPIYNFDWNFSPAHSLGNRPEPRLAPAETEVNMQNFKYGVFSTIK